MRRPKTVPSDINHLHEEFQGLLGSKLDKSLKNKNEQLIKEEFVSLLRSLGKKLSLIILPDEILERIDLSLKKIPRNSGLRIRLCLDKDLIDLPWEYIFVPENTALSGFLIPNRPISIVREPPLPIDRETESISQESIPSLQKQNLVFSGTFWKGDCDTWGVMTEYEEIKGALEKVEDLLSIEFIPSRKDNIKNALAKKTDIFHYSGHADQGEPYIIKEFDGNSYSSSDKLSSKDLGLMLHNAETKLAVFSACNSGRWNFVKPLVDQGVPVVLGAYGVISVPAAILFCDKFYSGLASGVSFDEAIIWARNELWQQEQSNNECPEWGSFMAYMPSKNYNLFPRPEDLMKKSPVIDDLFQNIRATLPSDYQDFWIRVQENNRIYSTSKMGENEGDFELDLSKIKGKLDHLKGEGYHTTMDGPAIVELGSTLFKALFPREIYGGFRELCAKAGSVRIRLTFDKPEHATLPWEFLYRDDTDQFLAIDPDIVLSRYIFVARERNVLKPAGSLLKILVVISYPKESTTLDAENTIKIIKKKLKKHKNIDVKVIGWGREIASGVGTIELIEQKINEESFDIIHFIAHGEAEKDDKTDEDKFYIELVDEKGQGKLVDDRSLANLILRKGKEVGLVILDSCRSGETPPYDSKETSPDMIFSGMAPRLVQHGIPAVIAMHYDIDNKISINFADNFYYMLSRGKPIDEAIQSARKFISVKEGLNNKAFATPVLYMRSDDGKIFDLDK
jgi:hypothetical protein